MIIRVKKIHMVDQFYDLSHFLKEVAYNFAEISNGLKVEPTITRIIDPVKGESGVHLVGRAIDFRDEHGGAEYSTRLYTDFQANRLLEYFNTKYARRDKYKTLLHYRFQGGMLHFHLQIPADLGVYKNQWLVKEMSKDKKREKKMSNELGAYDPKMLLEKLKGHGLDLAEDAAGKVVQSVFEYLKESAAKSDNTIDDLVAGLLGPLELYILAEIDKIDGKVG